MDPVRIAESAIAAFVLAAVGAGCGASPRADTVVVASSASSSPTGIAATRSITKCGMLPPPGDVPETRRQGWIAEPSYRVARRPVEEVLTTRFGAPDKTSTQLERGYLGTALDYDHREMVIVVDPALVPDPGALQDDLGRAGAERHAADPDVPVLAVRVQASCVSVSDLRDARELIRAQDWHPDAKGSVSHYSLDPGASAFRVGISGPRAKDVGAELERRLGPAVVVEAG